MLFNSIDFAIFFPIVFVLYWLVAGKLTLRNILILVASYVFYGWWDWRFLFLIAISSGVDFIVGQKMSLSDNPRKRKLLLGLSLLVNLGFLVYFKYANFFVDSFVEAFSLFGKELQVNTLNIILPVGISFYTFQTLSYTIDIYRNKIKPTKDALSFFTFVAFYPQLVAGPIERASHLLPQFSKIYRFDYKLVKSGVLLMTFGLFKKMVIADRAALYVNEVYADPSSYGGVALVYATIFFAFQIYCDFSGYSDIAIGAARTMGFDIMKNFDSPYFSRSLTEFWHRWHISLSTWFRDYVYIPLGGSRKGPKRTYVNLFIVFVVSGLWHGAAWTFVIWGAIHGLGLMIEKATANAKKSLFSAMGWERNNLSNKLLFASITFVLVCLAWVFFRADGLSNATVVISRIFSDFHLRDLFSIDTYLIGFESVEFRVLVLSIIALVFAEIAHKRKSLLDRINGIGSVLRWVVYLLIIWSIVVFGIYGDLHAQEFIYFQF